MALDFFCSVFIQRLYRFLPGVIVAGDCFGCFFWEVFLSFEVLEIPVLGNNYWQGKINIFNYHSTMR